MTRTPAVMEIEPCPFCGETELRVAFSHEAGRWDIWTVECESCCVSKDGELGFVGDAARQSAIAAWNHRTPAEPLADGEWVVKVAEAIWRAEWAGGEPPYPSWAAMCAENYNAAETYLAQARAAIAAYNPNDRLREALEGIERIAEKHTGVSGSRSLQTAMLAISFAASAALSHKD